MTRTHLQTHLLPLIVLGLGCPGKEVGDILGHLWCAGGSSILVLDKSVVEYTGHSDTTTWEVADDQLMLDAQLEKAYGL
jgi:hypothetical protein